MTRRPANRRPRKLESVDPAAATPSGRAPTVRQRLMESRVSGRQRVGRTEVLVTARRVVRAEPAALYELAPFERLGLDEVIESIATSWGPDLGSPDLAATLSIDPDRTLASAAVAFGRIADVARRGGRLLFATTRPASLLGLTQELVRLAEGAGGEVLSDVESGPVQLDARSDRHLRWLDGVAVVTDGEAILGGPGFGAADELLFQLRPPDLVVADRAVAGGCLTAEVETVALSGLDGVALGVAAHRGEPLTLVPLDATRPPVAYDALIDVARDVFSDVASSRTPAS